MKKLLLLTINLLLFISTSFATTLYVSAEGSDTEGDGSMENPFATVAHALDQAAENDIIHVSGLITENAISIMKSITLEGDNPKTSIIQGHELTPTERLSNNEEPLANQRVITVNTTNINVIIRNLTIQHGFELQQAGGLYHNKAGSELTVENCNFIDNYAQSQGGAISAKELLTIRNSSFINNKSATHSGALNNTSTNIALTIENCLFYGNTAGGSGNGGAVRANSRDITLVNNTFAFNNTEGQNKVEGVNIFTTNPGEGLMAKAKIINNLFFNNVEENDDRIDGEDFSTTSELFTEYQAEGNIFSYIHATADRNIFDLSTNFHGSEQVKSDNIKFGELQQADNGLYILPVYPTSIADNMGSAQGTTNDAVDFVKTGKDIGHIGVGAIALSPIFITDQYQNYAENQEGLTIEMLSSNNASVLTITGGEDQDLFTLKQNKLAFKTQPRQDQPLDFDQDNTYKVEITATEGEISTTQLFELSIVGAKLNVVMIVLDDLNDYIGFMGGHLQTKTPNIDKLAASGVSFMNAHSNAPLCDPSRASFLNGILPMTSQHFGTGNSNWKNNEVLKNSKLISEYFMDNDYTTYKTGKITHSTSGEDKWWDFVHENSQDYGPVAYNGNGATTHDASAHQMMDVGGALDGVYGRLSNIPRVRAHTSYTEATGQRYYEGWYSTTSDVPFRYVSEEDRDQMPDEKNTDWTVANIQALDQMNSDDPFFMAVGIIRPHSPFVVPDKYFDMFPLDEIELPEIYIDDKEDYTYNRTNRGHEIVDVLENTHVDKNEGLKKYFQGYLASVAFADEMVGRVVDAVENSQFKDNTVIMLFSDHGYLMGEKDYAHKNNLWEHSTRVPLIIKSPLIDETNGQKVEHPVSLIDIYPTLQDMCSLTGDTKFNEMGADLDGHSLKPFLYDVNSTQYQGDEVALSTTGNWFFKTTDRQNYSIKSKRYRYINRFDNQDELYDHQYDQNEFINVIDNPAYAEVLEAFHQKLEYKLRPNTVVNDELENTAGAFDASENWKTFSKTWGIPYSNDNTQIQRKEEGDTYLTYEVTNPGKLSFETWVPILTIDGKKVLQNFGEWKVEVSEDNSNWTAIELLEIVGNYTWDSNILTYENLNAFPENTKYIKISLIGNGDDHFAASIGKVLVYENSDRNTDMNLDEITVDVDPSLFEIDPRKIRTSEAILPVISDDFSEYGRYYSKSQNTYLTDDEGNGFHKDGQRLVRNSTEDAEVIYQVNEMGSFRIEVVEIHSGSNVALNDTTLKDHIVEIAVSEDNETYLSIPTRHVSLAIEDVYNNGVVDEWRHSQKFALVPADNIVIPEGVKFVKVTIKNGLENTNPSAWNLQLGGVYFYNNYLVSGSAPMEKEKKEQTISIEEIEDKLTTDGSFEVIATTTSDLALDYAIEGPATLDGTTVSLTAEEGTVTITVSQEGNEEYKAASKAITFVVTAPIIEKKSQTITIEEIEDKLTTDGSFEVIASTTSGLVLDYAIEGPATLDGTTVSLTTEEGTVTITVLQEGNEEYNAASKSITFEVTAPIIEKKSQTITIEGIEDKLTTDVSFEVNASTTSGLVLDYAIEGPATLDETTVSLTAEEGTVTITVSQEGNEEYNAASKSITFEVSEPEVPVKKDQEITVNSVEDKYTSSESFEIVASTNSGLLLSYKAEGPASISGKIVTLTGETGIVTITISQEGNEEYNAAEEIISFEVKEDIPTSIEGLEKKITVYPNPANNILNIKGLDKTEEIVIINLIGQEVKSVTTQKSIAISTLQKGIYFLKFNGNISIRFIKN